MSDKFNDAVHVMIDVETLDTTPTSAVIELGAVVFGAKGVKEEGFQRSVNVLDELARGFTVDEDTLEFWRTHPETLDEIIQDVPSPTEAAFTDLHKFLVDVSDDDPDNLVIWANGVSFDIPILEHHFKVLGLERPWFYWNVRDFRTLRFLHGDLIAWPPSVGEHRALEDARYQAEVACRILCKLQGGV